MRWRSTLRGTSKAAPTSTRLAEGRGTSHGHRVEALAGGGVGHDLLSMFGGAAAAEAHAAGASKAHFGQVMARLRVRWSWGWLGEGSRKMALTTVVPPQPASGVGGRLVGGWP